MSISSPNLRLLHSRVALDTVLLAKLGLVNAVNLGELDGLVLEGISSLLILRCERLAVTTPSW
jgi:hypothetical protein